MDGTTQIQAGRIWLLIMQLFTKQDDDGNDTAPDAYWAGDKWLQLQDVQALLPARKRCEMLCVSFGVDWLGPGALGLLTLTACRNLKKLELHFLCFRPLSLQLLNTLCCLQDLTTHTCYAVCLQDLNVTSAHSFCVLMQLFATVLMGISMMPDWQQYPI